MTEGRRSGSCEDGVSAEQVSEAMAALEPILR